LKALQDAAEYSDETLTLEQAVMVDESIPFDDYQMLKSHEETLSSLFSKSLDTVVAKTKKEMEALQLLKANIVSSKICPLCGTAFDSKDQLLNAIEKQLGKYVTDEDKTYFLALDRLADGIQKAHSAVTSFFPNLVIPHSSIEKMSFFLGLDQNFVPVERVLFRFLYTSLFEGENSVNKPKIETFFHNDIIIKNGENEVPTNPIYFQTAIIEFEKMITLPEGFHFKASEQDIQIVGPDNFAENPDRFLSDSESRRLCLAILTTEVKLGRLKLIVFDDPVDSCDDFSFSEVSYYIGDLLVKYPSLEWVVFSHEFRLVSILSSFLNTKLPALLDWQFLFYLFDPLFRLPSGGGFPPLLKYSISPNQICSLEDHEIVLFEKIFGNVDGFVTDPELALLAFFGQIRNFQRGMFKLKINKINNGIHGKLRNESAINPIVTKFQAGYLHYSPKHSASGMLCMQDLISLGQLFYENFQVSYPGSSTNDAIVQRDNLISRGKLASLSCQNPLLLHILVLIVRVTRCKWLFEKRLYDICVSTHSNTEAKSLAKTAELGNKIALFVSFPVSVNNGKGLLAQQIYDGNREMINDFEHSTVRMFPPFLSYDSGQLAQLEAAIANL